jgi:hypothetical protein
VRIVSAACADPIETAMISELDARAVRLDPDFHILVDRPLHGHEDFHGLIGFFRLLSAAP